MMLQLITCFYYTIPSNNRELRLKNGAYCQVENYTIPSNNRELRHQRQLYH